MRQAVVRAHVWRILPLVVAAVLATGCTVRAVREAPIEDKSSTARVAKPAAPIVNATPAPPPSSPREASNGTYIVQRGDTLYSIAIAFGHDYRDIARWNNLDDPTKIAVGQTLRVAPPEGDTPAAAVVGVVTVNPSAPTETRPLDVVPQSTAPSALPPPAAPPSAPLPSVTPPGAGLPAPPAPSTVPPVAAAPAPDVMPRPAAPSATLVWQWPAKGKVVDGFSEGRNKGIDIGGNEGDAVLAAGDGEVVYSGSGLRTYGNLVIIKHNDDFISAYGHNKQILVKQGDPVRRGQRIANLGKADDGAAKLHFEIRYKGKPVDPARYLPPAR
jgi:lipoprotein NlpD